MGVYLNSGNDMFMQARRSKIYVDKSGVLSYLNSVIGTEQKYICVSRPRRFGKSITANMIANFYDRTCRADEDFSGLEILNDPDWHDRANHYNVLHINMQNILSECRSMDEFLQTLCRALLHDLLREYKDVDYYDRDSLPASMSDIYAETRIPFIVVIDEWDCLFREYKEDSAEQRKYLDFLRTWLKDRPYIGLCYMTGILPIKKYGTHSALNMFTEFSMENPGVLASYTGFTEEEVKHLCRDWNIDFEECSHWYDGYYFRQCGHIYNPKSIVSVMLSGIFDDYWSKTETYEALRIYIDMNFDGLRDAIISMMAGGRVRINTGSFQNDMTTFHGADDVMTLLVHLGYLGYDFEKKEVFIPNHEILSEFVTATSMSKWDEIIDSIAQSDRLLKDTWDLNSGRVAAEVERAHLETSHLQYNDENALSYTISLAYYSARQYYTVLRELPTGKGFADLVFIPRKKYPENPALVVELKWNKSANTAIRQIKEKRYPDALKDYHGNLLLVGVNYSKKTRKHSCKIEQFHM